MLPLDSTIKEQVEAFQRRLAHRQRLYQEAVAALVADRMRQQLKQVTACQQAGLQAPRQRRWLSVPYRALARGFRWLLSLAIGSQGQDPETQSSSPSATELVVIDVDVVYVDSGPVYHHPPDWRPSAGLAAHRQFTRRKETDNE